MTFYGRRLLVERVVVKGQAVAQVAKAMGMSRQCGHRWVRRFKTGGVDCLHDRSSRPHSMPTRTSAEIEAAVVAARREHRRGQDWLGPELGVAGTYRRADPAPPRRATPGRARSTDWHRDPGVEDHSAALRAGPTGRAGSHGRQEDRAHPGRGRLARPRPSRHVNQQGPSTRSRLRLRPRPGR